MIDFLPKTVIETVVDDDIVDSAVKAIAESAKTGKVETVKSSSSMWKVLYVQQTRAVVKRFKHL